MDGVKILPVIDSSAGLDDVAGERRANLVLISSCRLQIPYNSHCWLPGIALQLLQSGV